MSKLLHVEGIRGLACFIVLISHMALTLFPVLTHGIDASGLHQVQKAIFNSPFSFFYSGKFSVYIFFVLSGYILAYAGTIKGTGSNIANMAIRRYPRLMIPAFVSVLLSIIVFQLFSDSHHEQIWINNLGQFDWSVPGALYDGTIGIFIHGVSDYNPVLWTMKTELIGSFIVFGLCYLVVCKKDNILIIELAVLVASAMLLGLGSFVFISGYLFFRYGVDTSKMIFLPLLLVGLYLAGYHNESSSYFNLDQIIKNEELLQQVMSALGALIVGYIALFTPCVKKLFAKSLFVFMGKVSFSVYLIHMSIMFALCEPALNFFTIIMGSDIAPLSLALLIIAMVYSSGYIFYLCVDKNGMKIAKKVQQKIRHSKCEVLAEKTY